MVRCVAGRRRGNTGGILGLVELIEQHGPALEYDLLTMTHYTLRDVGGALPWGALRNFVTHLPRTSALSRELVPLTEHEHWVNGDYNASILADIFDVTAQGIATLIAKGSGKSPKRVIAYPRPGKKPKVQHVGKDPIPIRDFWGWWNGN